MEIGTSSHANCGMESYVPRLSPAEHLMENSEQAQPSSEKTETRNNDGLDASVKESTSTVVDNSTTVSHQPNDITKHDNLQSPSTSKPNRNVGKYRLLRTIGKGNFAKVKLAIHMATGVEVAIKIINKTVMDSTLLTRLKREIKIMKVTNHPNIIKLLEIIENEDVLCLIMEYASGGEIFDYLVANGKMREKEARVKFRQLVSAIQYCHSKRIVHRDLKAENILLDQDLNVKVADFGLANTFENDRRLTTFCGSPPYAAPELFLGIPYYGPGVDVWSLGVILFTLVVGHLPFDARDLRELRTRILGLHYHIPKGSVTPECEALLRKMLVLDPKDRSSLKFLMQDKWVNAGYGQADLLKSYREPPRAELDEVRVKAMQEMGFSLADLESSVVNPEFDHIYATYHLLPETPSQFMALYNDLSQTQQTKTQSIVLPKSLMTSESPTTVNAATAIGRFTVAPSSTAESSAPVGGRAAQPGSADGAEPGHHQHHHSLTPALPTALRWALVQMGRTLAGTADTPASPGGPQKTGLQPMKSSHKTVPKSVNGTRTAVTAAPVPMMPSKKSGLTIPTSKRTSPTFHNPAISPSSSLRTSAGESSPETTATRNSHLQDRFHQAVRLSPQIKASEAQPPTAVGQQQVIANHEREAHKQMLLKRRTSPRKVAENTVPVEHRTPVSGSPNSFVDGVCSPLGKDESRLSNDSQARHQSTTTPQRSEQKKSQSRASPRSTVAPVVSGQSQPTDKRGNSTVSSSSTSSNTSTSSGVEREVRQTATALVQNICHFAEQFQQISPCSSSASSQPLTSVASTSSGAQKAKTPAVAPAQAVAVVQPTTGSPRPTATPQLDISEQAKKNSPTRAKQTTTAHTVQGHEARVLRDGALRLQPSQEPSALSTNRGPSNYSTVDAHPNTWGRSVRRALGGLFAQPKAQEHHSVPNNSPREVRFPWSVHTTSTKPADELLQNIIRTLESTPGCRYTHDPHIPFLVTCSWASDRPAIRPALTNPDAPDSEGKSPQVSVLTDEVTTSMTTGRPGNLLSEDPVHWEMEVCQLPRLHLRGVRLKRIRGSAIQFRPIADMIMQALQL